MEDNIINIKREFIEFLELNGISENYFNDLIRRNNSRLSRSLDDVLDGCAQLSYPNIYNLDNIIDAAIFWDETPEGHRYWSELNSKWYEYRQTKKKNVLFY